MISEKTAELLSKALDICDETNGALDITVYPIVKAWGFTTGENRVPSEEEIKNLMTDEGSWFTGQEAVDAGFCTAVMFTDVQTEVENAEKIIVNSVSIGLERFHTVPKGLLGLIL